ncbi:MAG: hypothetical protein R3B57_01325 [Phycisphaerales bacterium]
MSRSRKAFAAIAVGALIMCHATSQARAADPWADAVLAYFGGSNPAGGFTDPATALGSPERFSGEAAGFPGVVSPFSPAFGNDELVSIGAGGVLIVRFNEPVVDDVRNPFGLDLLIFGNAGFIGAGVVGNPPAMFGVGGVATVEVSTDAVDWRPLGARALDLFPTLGYRDSGPFDGTPGSLLTDFTRPVDPSIQLADLAGLTNAQLVDLYDGSGGGIGFDLAGTGLSEISYVRIRNFSGEAFEIDAFADVSVPSPAGLCVLAPVGVSVIRRRRR